MVVDGRKIADDILNGVKEEVAKLKNKPRLRVITCAPNFETKRYMEIKKKKAEEVGVVLNVTELPHDVSQKECVETIHKALKESEGIVIQLPFPKNIDTSKLIDALPLTHDVDALRLVDEEILPPVVGAINEILRHHFVEIKYRRVVVVGSGKLVGTPSAKWFKKKKALVDVVTKDTHTIEEYTLSADIIVLGAGKPGLLTPDMIKEGAIILDAGTSEEGGELKGDADPACIEKALLFTPVPGGIGPITIAILLRNLSILASRKENLVV